MEINYNFESETISGIFGYETLPELITVMKEEADKDADTKLAAIIAITLASTASLSRGVFTGVIFAINALIDDSVESPGTLVKYLLKLDEETLRDLSGSIMLYSMSPEANASD